MRRIAFTLGAFFLLVSCRSLSGQESSGEARVIYPYFRDGNFPRIAIEVTRPGVTVYAPVSGSVTVFTLSHEGIRILPAGKTFATLQISSGGRDGQQSFILNLGALDADVVLLVRQGQKVEVGDPLFKIVGLGPSQDFYFFADTPPYQVVGFAANDRRRALELSGAQLQILLEGRS